MKTKYEFRKKALDFAKRDEFKYDSVAVKGLYEDYEVYTPYCKAWKDNPPMIGLPQLFLNMTACAGLGTAIILSF